jgi:hypothetical protein
MAFVTWVEINYSLVEDLFNIRGLRWGYLLDKGRIIMNHASYAEMECIYIFINVPLRASSLP